jgi:uncharacterized membrane protein YecN with MAPEG domain
MLRLRKTLRIAIGDSGNSAMFRAMRVHSNFAEYVAFGLAVRSAVFAVLKFFGIA